MMASKCEINCLTVEKDAHYLLTVLWIHASLDILHLGGVLNIALDLYLITIRTLKRLIFLHCVNRVITFFNRALIAVLTDILFVTFSICLCFSNTGRRCQPIAVER